MTKKDILALIRWHYAGDELKFAKVCRDLAMEFYDSGELQLSEYILAHMGESPTFEAYMDRVYVDKWGNVLSEQNGKTYYHGNIYDKQPITMTEDERKNLKWRPR